MRIRIAGTSYCGAARGTCMAEPGHDVLSVDTDERKVLVLTEGVAMDLAGKCERLGLGPAELSQQQAPDATVCPGDVCNLSVAHR